MQLVKRFSYRTFSSFQIPNFRLYFIGQTISSSGTWLQNIAQGLLLLQLTGSGTALGFLIALQFLPLLLFGSFSGVIIDRFSKRRIFFFCQVAFAIVALLHGLFVLSGLRDVWIIYMLALFLGLITAIDNPTKQTFIYELVGKDKIKNAVSLNSLIMNLARVTGPALAAILVPTVGLAWCFFLNAISFVAVLFVLWKMDPTQLHKEPRITKLKGEIAKGFQYVKTTPSIRNILLMMFLIGTFAYEFPVILPLLAEFTFGNSTTGYAYLMTAMGAGAVIGGLFAAGRKKTSMRSLLISAFLFGSIMILTSFAPSLFIAAAAMVVVGFFSINFLTATNAMLQTISAPEMRGRVMSFWSIAFLGTTPIGGPIIGWIGETFGPRWGMAVGGLAAILAAILIFFLRKQDKERKVSLEIVPEQALNERNMNLK